MAGAVKTAIPKLPLKIKRTNNMSKLNVPAKATDVRTAGGAKAWPHALKPMQMLRRSVLACLLWEDEFYEDGQSIAARIEEAALKVSPQELAAVAVEARSQYNLRHVPLLLLSVLARTGSGSGLVAKAIEGTVQRTDELTEFLAIYWRNGRTPLSAQIKKGLAKAFRKFNAYQLAKYNRDGAIKLRDVLRLVHPKPSDTKQAEVWKQLLDDTLPSPDTWEVALSGGKDKKETFERLIRENKLGYFALLRNLRNMEQAGCNRELVRNAILARQGGAERILPFRYIAAARAAPQLEPQLDVALGEAIKELSTFRGTTAVLVDVSASMDIALSAKSDLTRADAAAALASIIPAEDLHVYSFSSKLVKLPPRKGMAGVDSILKSQTHSSTELFAAIDYVNKSLKYDRIIVITDEQATSAYGRLPAPTAKGYMINVASNKNGVGYGPWINITGFSENIIRYIQEIEKTATD
jgi:60 kDa SS-A/Ro ribonucleoprotein